MPVSYSTPRFQADDDGGRPLVGGRLFVFHNKTTNPAETYQDALGQTSNTTPIVLNARGEAVVFLDGAQVYTFVLYDRNGSLVWSQDGVSGAGSSGGTVDGGIQQRVFTESGVFVVPEGIYELLVSGVGGGGAGGKSGKKLTAEQSLGAGGGGGGGAGQSVTRQKLAVQPGDSLAITVGAAGVAASVGVPASAATATSVGSLLALAPGSAGGDGGDSNASIGPGGYGGPGYPAGSDGSDGANAGNGGAGATSPFGGGGGSGRAGTNGGSDGQPASGFGAGGGGAGGPYAAININSALGGNGSPGFVSLEWSASGSGGIDLAELAASVQHAQQIADDIMEIGDQAIADFETQSAALLNSAQIEADAVLKSLGYEVPVAFAPGLAFHRPTQTVTYNGQTYAAVATELPFVTDVTFEPTKFRLIQGVSGTDLSQASGAAMVGFKLNAVGATISTINDVLYESVSIMRFLTDEQKVAVRTNNYSGSVTDVRDAFINAREYMRFTNTKRLYCPSGSYRVLTPDPIHTACTTFDIPTFQLTGDGDASVLYTVANTVPGYEHANVVLHVTHSGGHDLATMPDGNTALTVRGFKMDKMAIRGTGGYQNYGLSYGRGVLYRRVEDVSITNCLITDMSMIGASCEGGRGYISVQNNRFRNNRYGAIACNGGGYQSIVMGNICSGSNAGPNSVAIQVTGHSICHNNTVFGDINTPENCGGIAWGEGNYHGFGAITGNLIKSCRYGILAALHGPVMIANNVILNCVGTAAIGLNGETHEGYVFQQSNNMVINNFIVNCANFGINCTAENTVIRGNKVWNKTGLVNASAPTQPDAMRDVVTQVGIYARGNGISLIDNDVDGCLWGIVKGVGNTLGVIRGNKMGANMFTYAEWSSNGAVAVPAFFMPERVCFGADFYKNVIISTSRPTAGFNPVGSEWTARIPVVGAVYSALVAVTESRTITASSAAGSSTATISGAPWSVIRMTDTVIGLELDNGQYHWTVLTGVSGSTITFSTPIPTGRSTKLNGAAYYNLWANKAVL